MWDPRLKPELTLKNAEFSCVSRSASSRLYFSPVLRAYAEFKINELVLSLDLKNEENVAPK